MKQCTRCLKNLDDTMFSLLKYPQRKKKKIVVSSWCKPCVNEKTIQWRERNREKWLIGARINSLSYGRRLRAEIVIGYGSMCNCCGEKELLFLELDHVLNDGFEERKTNAGQSLSLYRKLINLGFPRDRYQLLCSNCNQGKRRNGGICPHKTPVMA